MVLKGVRLPLKELVRALGYGTCAPDEQTRLRLKAAVHTAETAAHPLWAWRMLPLDAMIPPALAGTPLSGKDIAAHLQGCHAAILFALTLGRGMDDAIRRAAAVDLPHSVLLDAAASALAEQCADAAEQLLCTQAAQGQYLTGRFSPGYGDFPLDAQAPLLRLLDAPRAIGLSAGEGGMLLPRKSITAVVGVAHRPVAGLWPGCESCVMAENCRHRTPSSTSKSPKKETPHATDPV